MSDFNIYARERARFYGIAITENTRCSKLINSKKEEAELSFDSDILNYFGFANEKYVIDYSKLQSLSTIQSAVEQKKEGGEFKNSKNTTNNDSHFLAA